MQEHVGDKVAPSDRRPWQSFGQTFTAAQRCRCQASLGREGEDPGHRWQLRPLHLEHEDRHTALGQVRQRGLEAAAALPCTSVGTTGVEPDFQVGSVTSPSLLLATCAAARRCAETFSNYKSYARTGCLLARESDESFDAPVLKRAEACSWRHCLHVRACF